MAILKLSWFWNPLAMFLIFWILLLSPSLIVGYWLLAIGLDVADVSASCLGCLANRLHSAVRRPEVPLFPELPA